MTPDRPGLALLLEDSPHNWAACALLEGDCQARGIYCEIYTLSAALAEGADGLLAALTPREALHAILCTLPHSHPIPPEKDMGAHPIDTPEGRTALLEAVCAAARWEN